MGCTERQVHVKTTLMSGHSRVRGWCGINTFIHSIFSPVNVISIGEVTSTQLHENVLQIFGTDIIL